MRPRSGRSFLAAALALFLLPGAGAGPPGPGRLPAIVFVSRQPIPGDPRSVPGLGPHHRTAAPGGRLMVREPDGRVHELVATAWLHDVSDPAVSPDARSVAFAGTPHPDSAWRIYLADLGGGLVVQQLTSDFPDTGSRFDDFDPCWIGADRICFASTRLAAASQYADVPVTNLYVIARGPHGSPSAPARLTMERNGAEEPAYDAAKDRIVYSRWWFSRFRAAERGLTTNAAEAIARDSVNLWQAVAIPVGGGTPRLAFGDPAVRRGMMAYQPAPLAGGGWVAVYALNLGLSPRPGPLGVQRFGRGPGPATRLAGAVVPDSAGSLYDDALGLAAPAACAPAGLPDGRVLFSYAPGARGDFGLYVMDASGRRPPRPVLDLAGTLELDAAPVVRRRLPARPRRDPLPRLASGAATRHDDTTGGTFTYHSLGVFESARRGTRGSPRATPGARIRFYASPFPSAHGSPDSTFLVREAPIRHDGSVEERGLPADLPLFEQIVDAAGRVVVGPLGPAHVAGFNAGMPGRTSRCVGCHVGHSAVAPR